MELAERARRISPSSTLAIDAKAKELLAAGQPVISFGVGEPDFDTPQNIKDAAIKAITDGYTRYTAVAGIEPLKHAIVNKLWQDNGLKYEPSQIIVSSGAKHSLYNCFAVLLNAGDEVILPAPYWVSYEEQIKLAEGKPVIIKTQECNGYKLMASELEAVITSKTKVVVLASPSNPTGSIYSKAELEALALVIVKHKLYVISDEIYEKLIYDGLQHVSIASLNSEVKELTVVINGVSKAYAMTGWRIGYAAGPLPVIKAMSSLQSHSTSNPNSIAQWASLEALTGEQREVELMVREFETRRNYMFERLTNMPGITCNKPEGAFYLYPNVSGLFGRCYEGAKIEDASQLSELLLEQVKIAVVPGTAFGTSDNIRLSYANSMDNIKEGMDRLEKFIGKLI